ncbi:hypothetical protein [uncultured Algibacter sp.]|uniref:hypothetical protein n=1 Tax=uncultured Algibacter sp. TaxID=298659 RepID=UPI0030EDF5D1|tara:strand:+ start:421 stop:1206 length:786 start_codon:yes stop_codon:yes gene_type:complete
MDINLKNYAELSHNILNSETQYQSNKAIISALFNDKPTNDFESVVKNRITIIDSYYSTQMSKRLYGIDELANTLAQYSDDILKTETTKFLNNPREGCIINSLFSKEYGIDKSGKAFGKSISLISKYIYFLNAGNFPIYDSLAIDSYKLLKKNRLITTKITINEENYFGYLKQLNLDTNINNYEKLDNLLWLLGKLSKGSFAILMNKDKYESLIKNLSVKLKSVKSKQKDNLIRKHIKEIYQTSDLFSDNQKTFFEFVFSLK